MRHAKRTFKIGRNASHRRCMIANQLKSLIDHGRIETSVTKAKELRRHADHMITLAKKNTLASRRRAIQELMIAFNTLTPKESRAAKNGDLSAYNADRRVIGKLFNELSLKYVDRQGGYTRIVKTNFQQGDGAPNCIIEYI
ncbi:MAG: 50S ribosomal protein L17 [Simkaniaceae bacterium]|nr:50S ribosomal protein L17 [Simkaniaceae bacterium]